MKAWFLRFWYQDLPDEMQRKMLRNIPARWMLHFDLDGYYSMRRTVFWSKS